MKTLRRFARWAVVFALGASAGHLPAQTAFDYDTNGNLVSRSEAGVEWTYVYDSENRLREVRRDGVLLAAYQYDFSGRRTRTSGPEGTTRFIWDDQEILFETDDAGNTITRYDLSPYGTVTRSHLTEGTAFFLFDALGSPVSLVRADASIAARYSYDAWGALRNSAGTCSNTEGFTGYRFDESTGLYYANARYYDPSLGRFLSVDPFTGGILEPPSLHAYLYAYANPTVYLDPDGRCVGELQKTTLCQAIAKQIAYFIGGDPEAEAEEQIANRAKVLEGRREFRAQTGRNPRPEEVVWSENGRALTSNFQEIDTSGRIEPDHAEWTVAGIGVGAKLAVAGARAAGASATEQIVAGALEVGDQAVGELVGVSPKDAADIARGVRSLSNLGKSAEEISSPRSMSVIEASDGGVELAPSVLESPRTHPTSAPARVLDEQPRDALGRFLSKSHPGQRTPGVSAVDDFIAKAEANGFEVIGREISVNTPFGQRRYDVVLLNPETRRAHAVEIKSSEEAFDRFDAPARQQFAADRWVSRQGAVAVGNFDGVRIDDATKVLWEQE